MVVLLVSFLLTLLTPYQPPYTCGPLSWSSYSCHPRHVPTLLIGYPLQVGHPTVFPLLGFYPHLLSHSPVVTHRNHSPRPTLTVSPILGFYPHLLSQSTVVPLLGLSPTVTLRNHYPHTLAIHTSLHLSSLYPQSPVVASYSLTYILTPWSASVTLRNHYPHTLAIHTSLHLSSLYPQSPVVASYSLPFFPAPLLYLLSSSQPSTHVIPNLPS